MGPQTNYHIIKGYFKHTTNIHLGVMHWVNHYLIMRSMIPYRLVFHMINWPGTAALGYPYPRLKVEGNIFIRLSS